VFGVHLFARPPKVSDKRTICTKVSPQTVNSGVSGNVGLVRVILLGLPTRETVAHRWLDGGGGGKEKGTDGGGWWAGMKKLGIPFFGGVQQIQWIQLGG